MKTLIKRNRKLINYKYINDDKSKENNKIMLLKNSIYLTMYDNKESKSALFFLSTLKENRIERIWNYNWLYSISNKRSKYGPPTMLKYLLKDFEK
jgi:hypothetical protein